MVATLQTPLASPKPVSSMEKVWQCHLDRIKTLGLMCPPTLFRELIDGMLKLSRNIEDKLHAAGIDAASSSSSAVPPPPKPPLVQRTASAALATLTTSGCSTSSSAMLPLRSSSPFTPSRYITGTGVGSLCSTPDLRGLMDELYEGRSVTPINSTSLEQVFNTPELNIKTPGEPQAK